MCFLVWLLYGLVSVFVLLDLLSVFWGNGSVDVSVVVVVVVSFLLCIVHGVVLFGRLRCSARLVGICVCVLFRAWGCVVFNLCRLFCVIIVFVLVCIHVVIVRDSGCRCVLVAMVVVVLLLLLLLLLLFVFGCYCFYCDYCN